MIDNTIYFTSTAPSFESSDFLAVEVRGVERMSSLFEVEVFLRCSFDGGLSPEYVAELLASTCSVAFGPSGASSLCGVLREVELVQMDRQASATIILYRAVLVPRLWLSTLTHRSRCYMDTTIPDVIRDVLSGMQLAEGEDFELRIEDADYPEREYVAQYEETDFEFLSRWMERLGLFYYFEHDGAKDKLVIGDTNAGCLVAAVHPELTYSDAIDLRTEGKLARLRRIDRRMPSTVVVRDYNWRDRAALVSGEADADAENGVGLVAYFGEHVSDDGEAVTRAERRAEAWMVGQHTYHAHTLSPDLRPGVRFTLHGAPMGELDQEYLVTRVVTRATQTGEGAGQGHYANEIEAIAFATPYRPARETRWPRVDGILSAKIDAESVSAAAPVDERGRYSVVFHHDVYGAYGGGASRRIRMAQSYAGPNYGMCFTLHCGTEVLVSHIAGDPDRPIIMGAVPGDTTGTPVGSAYATRSAILSRSGIMIDLEDNA